MLTKRSLQISHTKRSLPKDTYKRALRKDSYQKILTKEPYQKNCKFQSRNHLEDSITKKMETFKHWWGLLSHDHHLGEADTTGIKKGFRSKIKMISVEEIIVFIHWQSHVQKHIIKVYVIYFQIPKIQTPLPKKTLWWKREWCEADKSTNENRYLVGRGWMWHVVINNLIIFAYIIGMQCIYVRI